MSCREYEEQLKTDLKKLNIKALTTNDSAERRDLLNRIKAAKRDLNFFKKLRSEEHMKRIEDSCVEIR